MSFEQFQFSMFGFWVKEAIGDLHQEPPGNALSNWLTDCATQTKVTMGKKNNCHVFEHTSLFTNSTTKTHTHNNKGNKRFCDGHKKFCKHETLYPGYGI